MTSWTVAHPLQQMSTLRRSHPVLSKMSPIKRPILKKRSRKRNQKRRRSLQRKSLHKKKMSMEMKVALYCQILETKRRKLQRNKRRQS